MKSAAKRFFREPWIVIACIWSLLAIGLSFFESGGAFLLSQKSGGYVVINSSAGYLRTEAADGFGWVFGTSFESTYVGLDDWEWENWFSAPELYTDFSGGYMIDAIIPHWLIVLPIFTVGFIRLRLRTNRVSSSNVPC